VLSSLQRAAGWTARNRSYSMNMMMGDVAGVSQGGINANNTNYVQFFKTTQVPQPSEMFVFLDEHPASINDGYFVPVPKNNPGLWNELPASYHNHATALAFADGHSLLHRWQRSETTPPPQLDAANIFPAIASTKTDYYWLLSHMSVYNSSSSSR
jgi:hypothetical protein